MRPVKRGEADGQNERAGALDIRLLGPITAERDGEPASLGGPRQRAVLARLALARGQVVTVDRLVEDVWAGEPPATAVNTLQSYVSLLRRALGDPQLLRREGPGYMLAVDGDVFDASRFEDCVAKARAALHDDPSTALLHVEAGLAEWHGPALADVVDEEWARPAAVRWDELRLEALETRFDALLALGRHGEAVGELERTTDEHPLREGFARRLMIALYRSGRQADALRVYSRTRAVLSEELGLDPTPELSELQTAILNHDPSLAAPVPVSRDVAAAASQPPTAPPDAAPAPQPASPVALPGPAVRAGAGEFVGRDEELAQPARPVVDQPGRRAAASPCSSARPGPASRGWRPASPPKSTSSAPSSCGAGRRPRRSSPSSRWSRPCARCCGRCPPRPGAGSPPSAASCSCSSPSSTSSCPKRGSSDPIPASSATSCSRRSPSCCAPSRPRTRC